MHIALSIILFIVAIIGFGLSILATILKIIFRISRLFSSDTNQDSQHNPRQHQQHQSSTDDFKEKNSKSTPEGGQKKIFSKDDGEYIEFEEIKD